MQFSWWILMVWGEKEYLKTPYAAVSGPNQTHVEMKSSPRPNVIFMTFQCSNAQHLYKFSRKQNIKKSFFLTDNFEQSLQVYS